jgi:hypothetical protein
MHRTTKRVVGEACEEVRVQLRPVPDRLLLKVASHLPLLHNPAIERRQQAIDEVVQAPFEYGEVAP